MRSEIDMERSFYTRPVLRDRERDRRSSPRPANVRDEAGTNPLVCAACGHPISDDAYRIEQNGAHTHTFVNPAGFVHHLGCFALAPGCVHLGNPEAAFSWFPGWSWQIAACARCSAHVGWRYRNSDDAFHGLIVAALRRG
jgi:hypothetical protein